MCFPILKVSFAYGERSRRSNLISRESRKEKERRNILRTFSSFFSATSFSPPGLAYPSPPTRTCGWLGSDPRTRPIFFTTFQSAVKNGILRDEVERKKKKLFTSFFLSFRFVSSCSLLLPLLLYLRLFNFFPPSLNKPFPSCFPPSARTRDPFPFLPTSDRSFPLVPGAEGRKQAGKRERARLTHSKGGSSQGRRKEGER